MFQVIEEEAVVLKDDQWPVARLIPISSASGIEAQERRATSALLAVLSAVEEFGRSLLKPLGAPGGRIAAFIEVPFKVNGVSLRPDGIITVSRAGRNWSAFVETKTAASALDSKQIDIYLDLARELEFDAVITISNQFVTSSTEYLVDIDRRKLKKVKLHHWSWIDILTEAVVQRDHRGISDKDQAYILQELIRYLSDPRSGAVSFTSMGSTWTAIRDGARDTSLRGGDPNLAPAAARWDDLVKFISLELMKDLGTNVRQILRPDERQPSARLASLCDSLVRTGRLQAELSIPDAAGTLELVADLRARLVSASTRLDAPREGRARGRVSWLLRQLQAAPDDLRIEAKVAYSDATLTATLAEAKVNPQLLCPDKDRDILHFVLSLTRNAGLNRDAGRGSFSDSVIAVAKDMYSSVLQELRAWKPQPPRLAKPSEQPAPPTERIVDISPRVADAVEDAQEEMEDIAERGRGAAPTDKQ